MSVYLQIKTFKSRSSAVAPFASCIVNEAQSSSSLNSIFLSLLLMNGVPHLKSHTTLGPPLFYIPESH